MYARTPDTHTLASRDPHTNTNRDAFATERERRIWHRDRETYTSEDIHDKRIGFSRKKNRRTKTQIPMRYEDERETERPRLFLLLSGSLMLTDFF